jgi:hypothetical protein
MEVDLYVKFVSDDESEDVTDNAGDYEYIPISGGYYVFTELKQIDTVYYKTLQANSAAITINALNYVETKKVS